MSLRFLNRTQMSQLSAALLTVCLASNHAVADEPVHLRILSYNIHHAEGIDRKLNLERIAKIIRSVKPDLVALQEVDQNTKRTKNVDQPAELARLTRMNVAFGSNIGFQGGQYGNAVLSRFPIANQDNQLLTSLDQGEQRGVLSVKLNAPALPRPLVFLATHLDHRVEDQERLLSVSAINQLVFDKPKQLTLLAGDMNATIDSPTIQKLDTTWTRVNSAPMPTIPVGRPGQQIDFVMFRPKQNWKVLEVRILDSSVASDHRAIFAVLEFVPSATTK